MIALEKVIDIHFDGTAESVERVFEMLPKFCNIRKTSEKLYITGILRNRLHPTITELAKIRQILLKLHCNSTEINYLMDKSKVVSSLNEYMKNIKEVESKKINLIE